MDDGDVFGKARCGMGMDDRGSDGSLSACCRLSCSLSSIMPWCLSSSSSSSFSSCPSRISSTPLLSLSCPSSSSSSSSVSRIDSADDVADNRLDIRKLFRLSDSKSQANEQCKVVVLARELTSHCFVFNNIACSAITTHHHILLLRCGSIVFSSPSSLSLSFFLSLVLSLVFSLHRYFLTFYSCSCSFSSRGRAIMLARILIGSFNVVVAVA